MTKVSLFAALLLAVGWLSSPASAAESCEQCLRNVQTAVGICKDQLPPEVKPVDPKKPSSAERKAVAERAEKSSKCEQRSNEGLNRCKSVSKCP